MSNSINVIENSFSYLLSTSANNFDTKNNFFNIDDIRLASINSTIKTSFIELTEKNLYQTIVLLNSHMHIRNEIVSIRVNTPNVEVVRNTDNTKLENVQISLVWPNTDGGYLNQFRVPKKEEASSEQAEPSLSYEENVFEVLFEVDMEPMSTKSFTIKLRKEKFQIENQNLVTFYFKSFNSENESKVTSEFYKK